MPKSSSRIEQIKSGIANLIKRGGADNPLWDVATMPMAPLGPAVLGAARDPGNRAMGAVRGAAGSIGGFLAGSTVGGGLGLLADLLAHGKLPPEEAERVVAAVRRGMSGGIGSAAGGVAGIPIGTHMATAGHMAPDAAKQADAIMRQGFIDKCAELGIDPVRLCKIAQAAGRIAGQGQPGHAEQDFQDTLAAQAAGARKSRGNAEFNSFLGKARQNPNYTAAHKANPKLPVAQPLH